MSSPGDDHAALPDPIAVKHYFDKFARIITHLRDVARATTGREAGDLQRLQIDIVENYLNRLANTFQALSVKHLMAGRVPSIPLTLAIDRVESGFPIFQEILVLASDFVQAEASLARLPDQAQLKEQMIGHILSEKTPPAQLQYLMSQRIYYETLMTRELFFPQTKPHYIRLTTRAQDVSAFLLHWAVYDGPTSLPVLYFMVMEDSHDTPIDGDPRLWLNVQSKLLAQSLSSLKLLTIGRGFDEDFAELHPKFLRRIYVGPMYSHAFTEQTGPLREVLAEVSSQNGSDWALSWTTETLVSNRHEFKPAGFFSKVQREIFELDQVEPAAVEAGVTRLERALILPLKPYQVLADRDPPGMRSVRKHVVAEDGTLMSGM